MHFRTHVRPEHRSPKGVTALTEYADGMIEHDATVGSLLKAIDDLGIADNTIVIYTTDNGPHANTWPDAATTPFRSEKNTNWEGAFRVPAFIRWPGHIKPNSVSNEIVSGLDWMPTLLAAAGDPDVKQKLLKGYNAGGMTYKVHLDGYNILPYLTGQEPKSPRREFIYFSDDGDLLALRYENWKFVFAEQRKQGHAWPFGRSHSRISAGARCSICEPTRTSGQTSPPTPITDWVIDHVFLVVPSQTYIVNFIKTFKEFPPAAEAGELRH